MQASFLFILIFSILYTILLRFAFLAGKNEELLSN